MTSMTASLDLRLTFIYRWTIQDFRLRLFFFHYLLYILKTLFYLILGFEIN